MTRPPLLALAVFVALLSGAAPAARAIPRDEALVRARTYAGHPWRCAEANQTGTCGGGYLSIYTPGDYVGLPYDWGGYASIDQFDQAVLAGKGVGSYPSDGILDCTVGVDCSGFVSRVWKAGHTTTSGMDTITHVVSSADLEPADAYNDAGYHVMLFERVQANGDPQFIEAVYYNVHTTFWEPWSYVDGFEPVRYDAIEGSPAAYPDGTADAPVIVATFPFVDERDTTQSASDLFDACLGAAPTKREEGPEVIYRVDVTTPGTLTAAVQDEAGVDIDVHVYRALNEADCVARHDAVVSLAVGCGSIYVVADTYTAAGGDQPGPYTLTLDLEPSGQACGAPDPVYQPAGGVGDPCDVDGSGGAPFCNPNLGAVVCIYSADASAGSFCSHPCVVDADCGVDFPEGCCAELDVGYFACLPAAWCGPVPPEPDPEAGPEPVAEALPEPSPEGSPEAAPEPTPEAAPEVVDASVDLAADGAPTADAGREQRLPDAAFDSPLTPEAGAEAPEAGAEAVPAPDAPGGCTMSGRPAGAAVLLAWLFAVATLRRKRG